VIRFITPLLCLCLVGAPVDVRAEVWRVPTEIFTIAVAIETASPGDTIRVVGNGGATYFVNLTVDKDLTIEGGWRADFLIRDPEIYVSVLRDTNGATIRPIIRVDGSPEVVIDGFQIRGGRFGVFAEEGADVVIRNCHFRDQVNGSAEPPVGGRPGGAARFLGGTLLMEGCTIEGLLTAFHGAALGLESMQRAIIRDTRISNTSNLPIFFDIFTPAYGGALYVVEVDDLRLENTEIAQCISLARGGLAYVERSSVTAVGCVFEQGSGSQAGGAFVLEECPGASFTDCVFERNRAVRGGALWVRNGGSLQVEGSRFSLNSPSANPTSPEGGAIWLNGTPFDIRDSTFDTNNGLAADAWIRGGGVRCESSSGMVVNTIFRGESTTGHGGAWSQIGGDTVFEGCRFEGNASRLRGGAMHIELAGSLTARNSLFWGNTGSLGGGIAASFTGRIGVEHCTFTGNLAGSAGAAIYLDTGAFAEVDDSILCCSPRGDLVYCSASELTVRNSNLWNDDTVNIRPELGGTCPDLIGVNGNIRVDPEFCAPQGPEFELSASSPCAGAASGGSDMGWAGTGCPGPSPLSVRPESWGTVKGRYRSR
jgi:hypothetical protein